MDLPGVLKVQTNGTKEGKLRMLLRLHKRNYHTKGTRHAEHLKAEEDLNPVMKRNTAEEWGAAMERLKASPRRMASPR